VPVSECVWATFFGEWNGTRPKYFFLFCWVCVGLLIFSLLKKRTSGITAWAGTAMWYLVPVSLYIWGGAVTGFADVPLAMSLLAAVFLVGEFYRSKNRHHILLMSVAIAGTFWIKKEGTLFVMAVLVFLVWKRVAWRTIATVVAVSAGFFLVYALTTVNVPHFFEKDITLNLSRQELLRRGLDYFVLVQHKLTNGKNWGDKLWYVFAVAWSFKFLCVSRKRWFNREFYFFMFLYLISTVALLFTCYDFSRNLDWAFDRLLNQIYPLLIVATFDGVGVKAPEEIVESQG
jgi:hypothetical protein